LKKKAQPDIGLAEHEKGCAITSRGYGKSGIECSHSFYNDYAINKMLIQTYNFVA